MPPPPRQVPWEWERLLALYLARRPRRVLEIGFWDGASFYEWVANAPSGALLVAVDFFDEDVPRAAREEATGWRSDVEVVTIAGDSTDGATFERVAAYAPFEWVFIDGSHVLADVTHDWLVYGGMVTDGVVALHDVAPATRPGFASEADRLWERIVAEGRYRTEEIVASPPQGWAGIGVVHVEGGEG